MKLLLVHCMKSHNFVLPMDYTIPNSSCPIEQYTLGGYPERPVEQKISMFVCVVDKAGKNAAYLGVS